MLKLIDKLRIRGVRTDLTCNEELKKLREEIDLIKNKNRLLLEAHKEKFLMLKEKNKKMLSNYKDEYIRLKNERASELVRLKYEHQKRLMLLKSLKRQQKDIMKYSY